MERSDVMDEFFEIEALDRDQFLKVRETLTRIGISTKKTDENGKQTLWQTCHVLHKRGRYYICHFKQMFLLDGRTKSTDFTDEDFDRTEYIVALLQDWGLVSPLDEVIKPPTNVMVVKHSDKGNWNLRCKYTIGGNNNGKS